MDTTLAAAVITASSTGLIAITALWFNSFHIGKRFDSINDRFTDFNNRLGEMGKQFDARFDGMNKRFDNRFDDMNKRFDDFGKRLDETRQDIHGIREDVKNIHAKLSDMDLEIAKLMDRGK